MAKVMVVTPTYCTKENRRLPLLLQAIYWAQQQSHRDMVHVIVDDGSTDETPDVLDRLAHDHPSLHVYHKSNGGSSAAVNFGVEQALQQVTPDFITISHSDDLLLPTSLEDRVQVAQSHGADFVYSDMIVFCQDRPYTWLRKAREFDTAETLYHVLLQGDAFPFPTMMWTRTFFTDTVGGFDTNIISAEDWDIALRSARELQTAGQCTVLHQPTVGYRYHSDNLEPQNIRNGTRWQCYKRILAKHFSGHAYQYQLARAAFRLVRAMIPEPMKVPLRELRDTLLSSDSSLLPYHGELVERMRSVDYPASYLSR